MGARGTTLPCTLLVFLIKRSLSPEGLSLSGGGFRRYQPRPALLSNGHKAEAARVRKAEGPGAAGREGAEAIL